MSQVWEVAYNIYEWPINILERGWKWDERSEGRNLDGPLMLTKYIQCNSELLLTWPRCGG